MSPSPLGSRFREVCRDRARSIAIHGITTGTTVTFQELARTCEIVQAALSDLRISPGAAVVSFVGNHPVFVSTIVACLEAGVALVPLGEATDAEAVTVIEQVGAAAVITDRVLPLGSASRYSVTPSVSVRKLVGDSSQRRFPPSVVLKLTSGSTHVPKAAMASEMNLVNDGRHVIDAMGIGPEDVNFGCIPLSHSYALGNIVMPLLWQGSPVALRHSFNPAQFVAEMTASGATVFPGVPFMFERIKSLGIEQWPSKLRLLITAGAPIDRATVSWFRAHLNRKVHSFYGSSETGGIAYDDSDDVGEKVDVGRAMPETTVSIGQPVEGAEAGRIFVAGNAVTSGYANSDSDDSQSAFCEGGFLTGDIGYVNDLGRLILTGRISSLVNVSGRKVDPAEVQRKLLELAGIADAQVLGIACQTRGQELVAFVIRTDATLTPIAIRQKCAESLSTHKIPRRFVFVDRFPINLRGKIDRLALQRLASGVSSE